MRFPTIVNTCLLACISTSLAETIPPDHILWGEEGRPTTLDKRQQASATPTSTRVADSACTNGPFTRSCWSNGYNAATDFDAKWPTTGKTVTYNWELKESTCDPDGSDSRPCVKINGQFPGPTLYADWGDTIQVTLKNSVPNNGTGLHWHGIRQLGTCPQDGVPGITECPLAPGDTKTYSFKATQFGTTWYHSHFSSQYGDGAFGAIVINGPASSNYDYDLGPYILNDWYYKTSWQQGLLSHNNLQAGGPPPNANTVLINGTNVKGSTGSYAKTQNLIKGKKYRLRLINTSADNTLRVSLDNHKFTVITSDLVPVKPWVTDSVLITVGQRYDVIFTANQAAATYWFRASAIAACASGNDNPDALAIFSYKDAPDQNATPSSSAGSLPQDCNEPDNTNLVPWVKNTVDQTAFMDQVKSLEVDISQTVTTNGQNIVVWSVNLTAINVEWQDPTLEYVATKNTSYPSAYNLIELPKEGIWTYWIIQEPANTRVPIPHPIHLHGHDFYVLGRGQGVFDTQNSPSTLTWQNPTRRDVALLPGGGWLAIAFPTDNPGAWLMHCHIAWHVSDGLAVQFLEAKDQAPLGDGAWQSGCSKWTEYQKTMKYPKTDSGLKMMMRDNLF
ncbi:multicopper oxidase [Karstenula rhodostoma CBS 690.94]|uniref:laccase n=1 Tax=Karstenula rhodostoma CBS 690.94 TaxID=1392251 RepID=A0A9P4UH77_9PLEO|nr:multicopper oxidase [Karstenula rhodostoma CBS 690.94]